jgi:dTDP-glucose 4,6-dehydratase
LETTIARCFAFVGPHLPLDAHFAIGNFIRDAMRGEPIRVKDGSPYRSYLYMADLAVWLWTILFRGETCHPYNVGSDREITISQLAKTIDSEVGGSVQPIESSSVKPKAFPSRYVPCVQRARSDLGLEVSMELARSIASTTSWRKLTE